ncbi:hypothetical protein GCM10009859_02550 [Kocuria salsicia]
MSTPHGAGCEGLSPRYTGADVGPSTTAAFVPSITCALSTGGRSLRGSVVVAGLEDDQVSVVHEIDEPVLLIDPP